MPMKIRFAAVGGTLAMALISVAPAAGQSLALKRVLMSTGGVAYLEHEARVDGTATLPLSVRLDQVDDVLKSIVLYDDSGQVGGISLAGRAPLSQIFRDLPFDQSALSSPVGLLNALSGTEVEVVGARTVRGRIMRVTPETTRLPDGQGTVTRHRIALQTATGIQHLIYEDAQSVRFLDSTVRAQIDGALTAVARHRVRDRRTLEIKVSGSSNRRVRVGYVVGAPLWKATYRLTVTNARRARLQGWAVIENMTGRDWNDVSLVLGSGNPVTFRQALYKAYYVDRPSVPVAVAGRVLPRPDPGVGLSGSMSGGSSAPGRADRFRRAQAQPRAAETMAKSMADLASPPAAPPALAQLAGTASSDESMSQVLFRFPDPVNLESGRSALLPIVARDVPVETVALYQPSRHARHPFAAVELTNDTGTGLPPGVVTHFSASAKSANDYIGDAELRALPDGESRLLSFALDNSVRIDRETKSERVFISAGMVDDGVLRQTYTQSLSTTYRIAAKAGDVRTLLIEQPRRPGWTLTPPAGVTAARLPGHYRLRVKLEADGGTVLTVKEEKPARELIRIGTLSLDRILAYAKDGRLDDKLRAAFARIADLKRALEAATRAVKRLEREQKEIVADQGRLRENLRRVPARSDLQARYLKRLAAQEDRLDALRRELAGARAGEETARRALAGYIATL